MHAGHFGLTVGSIIGSVRNGGGGSGATLESTDVHIGSIDVIGANVQVAVQHYGKPPDERPAFVSVGSISGSTLRSTAAALTIQNRDQKWRSKLSVDVGFMIDVGGAAIIADSSVSNDQGGDIDLIVRNLRARSYTATGIQAIAGPYGAINVTIDNIDVADHTASTTSYSLLANGAAYTAVNPGKVGATVTARRGKIRNAVATIGGGYALRTVDGAIVLGSEVEVSVVDPAVGFRLKSGTVGGVFRSAAPAEVTTF